jgi:hypothetical protein
MYHARRAAIAALAVALAACSENAVAPRAEQEANNVDGGGSTRSLLPGDTLHFSITIDPTKNATYDLGNGHSVYFPSGELCDPAKSTYGPTQWDQPCPKLIFKLTVNVTAWVDAAGHPYEDFSPSIRFLPTTNPAKFVILSLTDPSASVDLSMSILYCPSPDTDCYSEAATDPTLVTHHDPTTGKVWRRIKHFSGYNVAAGDEDPTALLNRAAPAPKGLKLTLGGARNDANSGVALRSRRMTFIELIDAKAFGYILASG